jgi:hypothetical protein
LPNVLSSSGEGFIGNCKQAFTQFTGLIGSVSSSHAAAFLRTTRVCVRGGETIERCGIWRRHSIRSTWYFPLIQRPVSGRAVRLCSLTPHVISREHLRFARGLGWT